MVLVQFLVVLLFLYIGMRVGGIGVGFAGGAGVIVLSALGATPGICRCWLSCLSWW